MFSHGETITVIRDIPGGVDDYGDPIPGITTETTYHGVAIAPRVGGPGTSSSEIDDRGRQGIVEGFTIYGPLDMDVTHTDRVRWRGDLFDVVGEPGPWRNPMSGRQAGVEVAIRRSQG